MKELLKSLPWLHFAMLATVSIAFAWLVVHLFNYVWWFPIGILSYTFASILYIGLFGLDEPTLKDLHRQRAALLDEISRQLHTGEYEKDYEGYCALVDELADVEITIAEVGGEGK